MRVDHHLWIGEEGEPDPPRIETGYSELDPCDKCGHIGQNAWISAAWPGPNDRFLDLYLCRDCLGDMMSFTKFCNLGRGVREF